MQPPPKIDHDRLRNRLWFAAAAAVVLAVMWAADGRGPSQGPTTLELETIDGTRITILHPGPPHSVRSGLEETVFETPSHRVRVTTDELAIGGFEPVLIRPRSVANISFLSDPPSVEIDGEAMTLNPLR